jgi:hypothetical protein
VDDAAAVLREFTRGKPRLAPGSTPVNALFWYPRRRSRCEQRSVFGELNQQGAQSVEALVPNGVEFLGGPFLVGEPRRWSVTDSDDSK